MTVRLIPERTVDSLFAAEVAMFLPSSLIWSPSNTRGQLDHQVLMPGSRVLSVECKGVVSNALRDPARRWKAPIDYGQLAAYLAGPLPIQYLLPAKPASSKQPWIRPCTDPDYNGWCASCTNVGPAVRRRWAGKDPLVSGAPVHLRLQPWFAHWCWVIPAQELSSHLNATSRPREVSCADADLEAMANATRLCHLLSGLADGESGLEAISVSSESLPVLLSDSPAFGSQLSDDDGAEQTGLQFLYVPTP